MIINDFINYRKTSDKIGKIKAEISFGKNEIDINYIEYNEGKNLISLNKFNIDKKNQIKRFKNIKVKTFKAGKQNNNFEVIYGKKLIIIFLDHRCY